MGFDFTERLLKHLLFSVLDSLSSSLVLILEHLLVAIFYLSATSISFASTFVFELFIWETTVWKYSLAGGNDYRLFRGEWPISYGCLEMRIVFGGKFGFLMMGGAVIMTDLRWYGFGWATGSFLIGFLCGFCSLFNYLLFLLNDLKPLRDRFSTGLVGVLLDNPGLSPWTRFAVDMNLQSQTEFLTIPHMEQQNSTIFGR